MSDEKRIQSMSDSELDYLVHFSGEPPPDRMLALQEIHRRQETKEQEIRDDNKKIKRYTVIILVFTILAVVIGLVSLLIPFFFPGN